MKKAPKKIEQLLGIKIVIIVFLLLPYIVLFFSPTDTDFGEKIRFFALIIGFNIFIASFVVLSYGLWKTWNSYKKSYKIIILGFIIFLIYSSFKYTPQSIMDTAYYLKNGAMTIDGEVTLSLEGIRTQYFLIEINNDNENPFHAHIGPNLLVGNTYRIYYLPYSRSILRAELISPILSN